MFLFRTNSTQFAWHIARMAIVVGGFVVLSGSSTQAGVILPWVNEPSANSSLMVIDLDAGGCGTATPSELQSEEESSPPAPDESPIREALASGFLEANGGASTPVSSSSGQTSQLVAATFQFPPFVPLTASVSRFLRERSLQLPHPPLSELLDPPKFLRRIAA